jgi:hypothetical protein
MVPVFSPDGCHLAYAVLKDESQYIVCDGIESPVHDWVRIPKQYDKSPGKFRYLARDGDKTWLVDIAWPKAYDWTNGLKPAAEG